MSHSSNSEEARDAQSLSESHSGTVKSRPSSSDPSRPSLKRSRSLSSSAEPPNKAPRTQLKLNIENERLKRWNEVHKYYECRTNVETLDILLGLAPSFRGERVRTFRYLFSYSIIYL